MLNSRLFAIVLLASACATAQAADCVAVATLLKAGDEIPPQLADAVPVFPEPYYNQWVSRTETPTHTYNFCSVR